MRSRVKKQAKHTKLAYAGFILALAVSFLALYYIWTNTAGFGKSIEGTRNLACVQYLKDNPGEITCPSFTVIETTIGQCCCYNPESTSETSNYGQVQVQSRVNSMWLLAAEDFKVTGEKSADYFQFEEFCKVECEKQARSLRQVGHC